MQTGTVATREEWLEARLALLAKEKAFSRARDELSELRRQLPWVRVEDYEFATQTGPRTLADLFDGRSQLVVQHYMFAPDWQDGCKSCSFWVDNLQGAIVHLQSRDVSYLVVSQASLETLLRFKERMGWQMNWVSSAATNFSNDFHVWYTPEQIAAGDTFYNFTKGMHYGEHAPGFSVFAKDDAGDIYHTYSCYARGLDMLNGAYHVLDLVPKGRDEQDLPASMAWLKLHDEY